MLIDEHAVRAAEHAVSARKAELSRQWRATRTNLGDKLVEPATLVSAALVGGYFGWRAGARKEETSVRCECPPQKTSSLLSGACRSIAIAGLQVIASIATEEFMRGTVSRDAETAEGASPAVDVPR